MSSDDEQGFGDLFTSAEETVPVYPIEELHVDRRELQREGHTNPKFSTHLEAFDHPTPQDRTGVELTPLKVYFRNKRHSLWGHRLWNAAKYIVKRMDTRMIDVRGKTVLELGAGLGVPSLAAFRNGARSVVVTDYPDADLLEIIEMNVKANCTAELLDSDAASFLLEEAERRKAMWSTANDNKSDENTKESILNEMERQRAIHTHCVVEPLLWGKEEHIQKVLSYTGGTGFDIVILSDILFNHFCNDDLADTLARVLQRSRSSAAYCVFSHHRAHKQVEDLQFFDKCVARGLRYEQLDEEIYPMMFPDDRGPVEIRQPVRVYKIVHYFDAAGAAFPPGEDVFDVVVHGTGVVESILSAALSRCGVRVLHCDGQDDYGGVFKTLNVKQMREYITARRMGNDNDNEDNNNNNNNNRDVSIMVDRMDEIESRTRGKYLLDLFPTHYLSNGETVEQLVASDMARHLELCRVSAFTFLTPLSTNTNNDNNNNNNNSGGERVFGLQSIPLTRSQVFVDNHMSLIQKRRLMKFAKDVEATVAEQTHARTAEIGDDPFSQTAVEHARAVVEASMARFAQEAQKHPEETLTAMLERKYGISDRAVDIVTLMQQLDIIPIDVVRSVALVRFVLTSIGAFGGETPFLQPMYGAGEVPQNMCRIAAVWNATFVLRRGVYRVLSNRSCINHINNNNNNIGIDNNISMIERVNFPCVELSNRQRIKTKVVVLPQVLASRFTTPSSYKAESNNNNNNCEVCFSRVIMITRKPLVTWADLRASGCIKTTTTENDTNDDNIHIKSPPIVFSLCKAKPGVVVHVQQLSAASEQAPDDGNSVIVHFTVNTSEMTAVELQEFVMQTFVRKTTSNNTVETKNTCGIGIDEKDVMFLASFVLREREEAERSYIEPTDNNNNNNNNVSETHKAHPYAVEEYRKRQQQQHPHEEEEEDSHNNNNYDDNDDNNDDPDACVVVRIPTLFQNLIDDGAYMEAARKAFHTIMSKLPQSQENSKPWEFLEKLPPITGEKE